MIQINNVQGNLNDKCAMTKSLLLLCFALLLRLHHAFVQIVTMSSYFPFFRAVCFVTNWTLIRTARWQCFVTMQIRPFQRRTACIAVLPIDRGKSQLSRVLSTGQQWLYFCRCILQVTPKNYLFYVWKSTLLRIKYPKNILIICWELYNYIHCYSTVQESATTSDTRKYRTVHTSPRWTHSPNASLGPSWLATTKRILPHLICSNAATQTQLHPRAAKDSVSSDRFRCLAWSKPCRRALV